MPTPTNTNTNNNNNNNPVVGIDPKTGNIINSALCTLYVWTGIGQPCVFVNQNTLNQGNPYDPNSPNYNPNYTPNTSNNRSSGGSSNTLLFVILGVVAASAITYFAVKSKK